MLRICQLDGVYSRMVQRYGETSEAYRKGDDIYEEFAKAQRREGQPTMPKFVDPEDPPSFQETMWKQGYKCQRDDWQTYVTD